LAQCGHQQKQILNQRFRVFGNHGFINRGSQLQSVWRTSAPPPDEKVLGEHPTQKPVALVTRCLLAATCEGDFVFDPFLGSGTTAIA
jgi:site-specific DNA-methyltransferase (adenine-specific)